MLRGISTLKGLTVGAIDGEIGSVHDVYFDAQHWTVRYFVVDTGTWLSGRRSSSRRCPCATPPTWSAIG
jgi:uncharacterized protein YrrD